MSDDATKHETGTRNSFSSSFRVFSSRTCFLLRRTSSKQNWMRFSQMETSLSSTHALLHNNSSGSSGMFCKHLSLFLRLLKFADESFGLESLSDESESDDTIARSSNDEANKTSSHDVTKYFQSDLASGWKVPASKRCSFQPVGDSFVVIIDRRKDESRLSNEPKISVSCFYDVDGDGTKIFSLLSLLLDPLCSWWCRWLNRLPWKTLEQRTETDQIALITFCCSIIMNLVDWIAVVSKWRRSCDALETRNQFRYYQSLWFDWPTIAVFSLVRLNLKHHESKAETCSSAIASTCCCAIGLNPI